MFNCFLYGSYAYSKQSYSTDQLPDFFFQYAIADQQNKYCSHKLCVLIDYIKIINFQKLRRNRRSNQISICFKALKYVLPCKFQSSSSNPKRRQSVQNRIRKSPTYKQSEAISLVKGVMEPLLKGRKIEYLISLFTN